MGLCREMEGRRAERLKERWAPWEIKCNLSIFVTFIAEILHRDFEPVMAEFGKVQNWKVVAVRIFFIMG